MPSVLLGSRFATWLTTCGDVPCVVKSMDVAPPQREPSLCWREFLGWRLATRLGLAVPVTQLRHDPQLGRISLQSFVAGARTVTASEREAMVTTPRGHRMLALDFVARNPDRRPQNILVRGEVVFPIDYNVAFDYAGDIVRWDEVRSFLGRWFQVGGICRLAGLEWPNVLRQVRRVEYLLPDAFLQQAVGEIEPVFLETARRHELLAGLRRRREALRPTLERWWEETIVPLQSLLNGGSSCHMKP